MDFLDDAHREDLAIGLSREFIGAVRRPHGDRQRVDLGGAHEIDRLIRVGQQLIVADFALDAVAIFLFAATVLQRTEHPEFAFNGCADPVRHIDDTAGDIDIVAVIRRRLGIRPQRAVHHHGRKAVLDRRGTGRFLVAMVLMHAKRNLRIHLLQRIDHLGEHDVVGIGTCATRCLHDDRRVDGRSRLHDGQALLHIVDIEGGHAVTVLSGMIQQLP